MLVRCDYSLMMHSGSDEEAEVEGSSDDGSENQAGPSMGGATRECSARDSPVASDAPDGCAAP